MKILKFLFRLIRGFVLAILGWILFLRIARIFYKGPMPHFMADLIDNPIRRRIVQPPDEMALRHGLRPGMTVLEIGPGNGRYTAAAARWVGYAGKVVAVDTQPEMILRTQRRMLAEGIQNVDAHLGDVYHLNYPDGTFDAAYMITVIGEIPEPERALAEIYRVLKPGGTLACSELLPDPDYPLPNTIIRWAVPVGFYVKERTGSLFSYTLVLEKPKSTP